MKRKHILPLFVFVILGCGNNISKENSNEVPPSKEFNKYWYSGEAEITSYKLEQARYGEIHTGESVLIYVTEPFSKEKQVKADNPSEDDYSVLKLNYTKKFNTGVYPYSMMISSFLSVNSPDKHALKITTSAQEWCGHAFMQLNNKNGKYEVNSYSYFESEGDQNMEIKENVLEDEIWSKIRLNPNLLPTGTVEMIPSSFYIRLMHKPLKSYKAEVSIEEEANVNVYKIYYPELDREIKINYTNIFPYTIEGWEETYTSGWGSNAKKLTTKATKLASIKSAYWDKHSVEDVELRKELKLE